jgi:hypothetical protein
MNNDILINFFIQMEFDTQNVKDFDFFSYFVHSLTSIDRYLPTASISF